MWNKANIFKIIYQRTLNIKFQVVNAKIQIIVDLEAISIPE